MPHDPGGFSSLLGQSALLRRLGLVGPRQMPIGQTIQPVLTVGGVGNLVGDPLEARAIGASTVTAAPSRYAAVELFCGARGGLIVEELWILNVNPDLGPSLRIVILDIPFARAGAPIDPGPILHPVLNIGGEDTVSQMWTANRTVAQLAPISFFLTDWIHARRGNVKITPIYVPPGFALGLHTFPLNFSFDIIFRFREIPELQGNP